MDKPNYGIDSPNIIIGLLIASLANLAVFLLSPHVWRVEVRWIAFAAALYFLLGALGMLQYSKVGKRKMREHLLDTINWRGDEHVLDVGCGRGLFLIGAARRLSRGGLATGTDVWVQGAITGNRSEAVLENAALEGVADRVTVHPGDARELPFADASFDVVLSNFVLHEVNTRQDRERILSEVIRVLKPGGRFLLVDFIFTAEAVRTLRRLGATNSHRTRVGRLSFWVTVVMSLGANQIYQISGTRDSLL